MRLHEFENKTNSQEDGLIKQAKQKTEQSKQLRQRANIMKKRKEADGLRNKLADKMTQLAKASVPS